MDRISLWDRHHKIYQNPREYDKFFCKQLEEILSRYGKMLVLWVDGAGTGGRSFNWEMYLEVIRKYQPEILIFQQGPANIRWCGNEDGIAPDPCWYEIDTSHPIFNDDNRRLLGDGKVYLPVECDVSIRAGVLVCTSWTYAKVRRYAG